MGDTTMFLISHKFTFIPLYLYFIHFIFKYTKKKFVVLIAVVLMVALTDVCASQIAKPYFQRLRPCHDTTLEMVHTVNNICGKQYGFFSSHASNIFGLASFFFFIMNYKKINKHHSWLLLAWATIVGYSRIYLGVHFPLDVLTGFLCGVILARINYFFLEKIKAI